MSSEPARPARHIATSELERELSLRQCRFDKAGYKCGVRPDSADDVYCRDHAKQICWCGAQAARICGYTGAMPMTCGKPLCAVHECIENGWSGDAHSEKGKEQWDAWSAL